MQGRCCTPPQSDPGHPPGTPQLPSRAPRPAARPTARQLRAEPGNPSASRPPPPPRYGEPRRPAPPKACSSPVAAAPQPHEHLQTPRAPKPCRPSARPGEAQGRREGPGGAAGLGRGRGRPRPPSPRRAAPHLAARDAVPRQLDHSEVALAQRALDVVEADADGPEPAGQQRGGPPGLGHYHAGRGGRRQRRLRRRLDSVCGALEPRRPAPSALLHQPRVTARVSGGGASPWQPQPPRRGGRSGFPPLRSPAAPAARPIRPGPGRRALLRAPPRRYRDVLPSSASAPWPGESSPSRSVAPRPCARSVPVGEGLGPPGAAPEQEEGKQRGTSRCLSSPQTGSPRLRGCGTGLGVSGCTLPNFLTGIPSPWQ